MEDVPGKGTITYVFEKNPEYKNFILTRKIDFLGRITEFCYRYDITHTYEDIGARYRIEITNVYVHLEKIVHPNQSYTLNTYEIATKAAGNDGKKDEYYRVKSKELIDGSVSYDKCSYTYDGCSRDYLSCRYITSPVSGNEYFGFSTTEDNGRTKVTSIYHDEYLKSLYDMYHSWTYLSNITDYSKESAEKMEELVYDNNNKLLIHKSYSYYKKKLIAGLTTTKYGTSLSDKISSTEIYVYDDYKDLLEYTNELGNKTTYTYELQYHRKASEIDSSSSAGERIECSYDRYGETITTHYREYDDLNNSSIKTHQVRKNRDAYGNVISEEVNNTADKYYTYENNKYLSSIITVVRDRKGKAKTIEERLSHDPNTGDLASYTDGNGNRTEYLYDIMGRLIKVTHPDSSYATIQYSNDDKNVVMTDELGVVTNITYNALGKIKSVRTPKKNESYEYDRYGRKISSYNGKGYTYYEYDCLDRIIKTTNPDNTSITLVYNDAQNYKVVTNEEGGRHYSYYDLAENTIKETTPSGKNTINNYNSKGQLTSTINANGFSTDYEYNCLGNVIRMVDTGGKPFVYQYDKISPNIITNVHTTTGLISSKVYDGLGRVLSEQGIGNFKRYYEHDGAGSIIKEINPVSGSITLYTHDSRNRLLSKSIGQVRYTYTYDIMSNVTSITSPQGTITYEYEDSKIKKATLPDGKSISYEFDQFGNIKSVSDYYGKLTLYYYDIMNRLVNIYSDGIRISYSYYPDGQLKESITEYGERLSQTSYLYDSDNNLTCVKNYYPDYQSYEYTYDGLGNQLSKTYKKGTTRYSYDAYSRVETVHSPEGNKTSYGYDAYGNISREVVTANDSSIISTVDNVYDGFNRLDHVTEEKVQKLSKLLISPEVAYVLADQQIAFTLTGLIGDGTAISDEALNEAVWTVSTPSLILNTTRGKTVMGMIPKNIWGAMSESDEIVVRAVLQGRIVEARVYKKIIQSITINQAEAYMNADQYKIFTISGIMGNGEAATDEVLSEAEWMVSSPFMTLNETKGKEIRGIIPKVHWDAMTEEDVIILRVALNDKVAEARVCKNGLKAITITPNEVFAKADRYISFFLKGTMKDGNAADYQVLNGVEWTISSPFMSLNTIIKHKVSGIIPKDNWNAMSNEDVIILKAALGDKFAESRVYKYGATIPTLQNLSITPTEAYVLADQEITFTIAGIMTDGSTATDELLSTAAWTVRNLGLSSATMTLNTTQGKTVIGVISKSEWDKMSPMDHITVKATLQDKTISAEVCKKVPSVLQSLSITPTEARALADQQITFTIAGTMNDRSTATDELLNTAAWTVSSSKMTLNATQGKTITGVIPKFAWDGMSSTDIITVKATLQDKTASSLVYKYVANAPVLQSLSITPSSAVIMRGQGKTFTLSGLMSDGTAAQDSLLNGASWVASSAFTLGSNVGKTVTVYYGVEISSTSDSEVNDINSQNEITILPIEKDLVAPIGNITAEADISTGLAGFSNESLIVSSQSDIINDIETGLDNQKSSQNEITNLPIYKTLIASIGKITGGADISTGLSSFSNEGLIASDQSYIINNIDLGLDNQKSSTTVDRKTTYSKYDNNGNMIEERVVKVNGEEISSYRYDEFNQLVEVRNPQGTTTFTYYPTGLRKTKVHGNEVTKFYYDGQNVILEEVNNSVKARNIFGIIGPVVRQITDSEGNMNSYFYIYNGHMDVVALLDENGDIIKNYEYDISCIPDSM